MIRPDDHFDSQSPSYRLVRALAGLRKAVPALRRGEQHIRWSDPHGPGIYAFSRIHQGEEVLVVLNSANAHRSAEMWMDRQLTPPEVELVDALDPPYRVKVRDANGGSRVAVAVPPYGARVLLRRLPPGHG